MSSLACDTTVHKSIIANMLAGSLFQYNGETKLSNVFAISLFQYNGETMLGNAFASLLFYYYEDTKIANVFASLLFSYWIKYAVCELNKQTHPLAVTFPTTVGVLKKCTTINLM